MGDRINNMGKMMNNPKQRNMYFLIGGVAILTVVAGFWFATRNNGPIQPGGAAQVAAVPNVNVVPGASSNPDYNQKILDNNKVQAQKALDTNKSFVSTVSNQNSLDSVSPIDLMDKEKAQKAAQAQQAAPVLVASSPAVSLAPVQQIVTPIQQPVVQQVAAKPVKKNKYGPEDYILIATLSNSWKNKAPSSEFDFNKDKPTTSATGTNAAGAATAASAVADTTPPLAVAGTIYNAILETAINSDEPSPVLAKIVSGPLKGTRLIGAITTNNSNASDKVVVQFTTASIPGYSSSVKLNAVAVDPDTTRTALASSVNHHYFVKYGLLLGASFLSGYASAIERENTTTSVSALGTVTSTQGQLDANQVNKQALGSVGTALANQATQNIQNIKTTIKVDGGSAIGILLMDDLKVTQK